MAVSRFLVSLLCILLIHVHFAEASALIDTCAMKEPIIGLNVGGRVFATTLATLKMFGDNFLSRLVEYDQQGMMTALKDKDGNYFIDRDGKIFDYILDYLRNGKIQVIPFVISREDVERELDFYGVARVQSPGEELRQLYHTNDAKLLEILRRIWPVLYAQLKADAEKGWMAVDVTIRPCRLSQDNPSGCVQEFTRVDPNLRQHDDWLWRTFPQLFLGYPIFEDESPSESHKRLVIFKRLLESEYDLQVEVLKDRKPKTLRIYLGPDMWNYLNA